MSNFVALKRLNNEWEQHKHFNWYITKRCNYECSYCSDMLHDKTSKLPTLEELKTAANNIFENIPPELCFFDFTGGEPCLIKDFVPFLQWLKDPNCNEISRYIRDRVLMRIDWKKIQG